MKILQLLVSLAILGLSVWLVDVFFPGSITTVEFATSLFGLAYLVVYIVGLVQWEYLMTDLLASALVAALIAPGAYVIIRYQGKSIDRWQIALAVFSLALTGSALLGRAIRAARPWSVQQFLARFIDERVLSTMILENYALVDSLARHSRVATPRRSLVNEAARELQRLSTTMGLVFTYASRRTRDADVAAFLRSRGRYAKAAIAVQAGLVLLPGFRFDLIAKTLFDDYKLVIDARWEDLAHRDVGEVESKSLGPRLFGRVVITCLILGAALAMPYLPSLIPQDQVNDVQATLVVSAFFALIGSGSNKP
jgi:hypothetical protein